MDGNESLVSSAAVCKASSLLIYEVKASGGGGWGTCTVKLTCNGVTHQNMMRSCYLSQSVLLQYEQSFHRAREEDLRQVHSNNTVISVYLTWVSVQKITRYSRTRDA